MLDVDAPLRVLLNEEEPFGFETEEDSRLGAGQDADGAEM